MVLGTLKYSVSKEEGQVTINWGDMPTDVVMLDTLLDWIVELQGIYDGKLKEVFNEGEQA